MTARLRETYKTDVFPALNEKFQYKNVMEVPKLVKVTINMGLGEAKDNAKLMEGAVEELAIISGQKPVITKAKKSIANFKVRQGMPVGAKVTLRGEKMYELIFNSNSGAYHMLWETPMYSMGTKNSRKNINYVYFTGKGGKVKFTLKTERKTKSI